MIASEKENLEPLNTERKRVMAHNEINPKEEENLFVKSHKAQLESRKMLLEFNSIFGAKVTSSPDVLNEYKTSLSSEYTTVSSIKNSSDIDRSFFPSYDSSTGDVTKELAMKLVDMNVSKEKSVTSSSDTIPNSLVYISSDSSERSKLQSPEASRDQADELYIRIAALTKSERTKFQNIKKQNIMKMAQNQAAISAEELEKVWLGAEADIEDVVGGICISIYLPKMIKIKVYELDGKKVCIEAKRKKEKCDNSIEADKAEYVAEFDITGSNVTIIQSDINYEYFAGVGLLFVYIENISLSSVTDNTYTRFTDNKSTKTSKNIIKSMKKGFKRIFGSKETLG